MRILVIDDEPEFRCILSTWLTLQGHDTDTIEDGCDVDEWIPRGDYDVVLLDLLMPRSNGLSLISSIRKLRPNTKIIIISAAIDVRVAIEAIKEGAQACLLKPLEFSLLEHELNRVANEVVTR
jgi:DNA-binding NtrC family response regulator